MACALRKVDVVRPGRAAGVRPCRDPLSVAREAIKAEARRRGLGDGYDAEDDIAGIAAALSTPGYALNVIECSEAKDARCLPLIVSSSRPAIPAISESPAAKFVFVSAARVIVVPVIELTCAISALSLLESTTWRPTYSQPGTLVTSNETDPAGTAAARRTRRGHSGMTNVRFCARCIKRRN